MLFRFFLLICVAAYPPVPKKAAGPADVWVGEVIIAKLTKERVTVQINGVDQEIGMQNIDYRVIKEDGDKIWVQEMDKEGWILKANVVRVREAVDYLEKFLKEEPESQRAKMNLAYVRGELGDIEESIKVYKQLIDESQGADAIHRSNFSELFNGIREYDNALKEVDKSLQRAPNLVYALDNRAVALHGLRRYEEALKDADACLNTMPDFTFGRVTRGNIHAALGNYDKALEDADYLLKKLPKNSTAHAVRARVFLAQKDLDKAKEAIDKALEFEPTSTPNRGLRAEIWLRLKRPDKARFDLDEAVLAHPKRPEASEQRAAFLVKIGKYEEAQHDFEEVLKMRPQHLLANGDYAWMLATCPEDKFRDGKKALALAKSACERTENKNGPFLRSLAAAYAETGDFGKAQEFIKKAGEDKFFAAEDDNQLKECQDAFKKKQPYRLKNGS